MGHYVMDIVILEFRFNFVHFDHKKSDNFIFVAFDRALPHLLKMDDFPKCSMSFPLG